MEQRVSVITLGVGDLERSQAFYEAMGWRRAAIDAEGVVFFQAGGMVVSLYPREELAKDAGVAAEGEGFGGFALAVNVRSAEEADAVLRSAALAGGRLVKPGAKAFWGGYSGYFADPDGFLWEVAWNPFWEMDGAGAIRLPQ